MGSYTSRLLARYSLLVALAVVIGLLASLGNRARAQIDISGDWNISVVGHFSGTCTATVEQTGAELLAVLDCSLIGSGTFVGSIDLATGNFSLSSDPIGVELEGTAAGDGSSISGTWDALGFFSGTFTGTRKAEPADGQVGNVDCNGGVSSVDAVLVLQYEAALITSLPCPENADVNEDAIINGIDAALILQVGAGLIDSLPPP